MWELFTAWVDYPFPWSLLTGLALGTILSIGLHTYLYIIQWSIKKLMAGWTWKHREANRLRNGTYHRVPFHRESWFRHSGPGVRPHYAHISREDPTKIAYTESEEKGKKDLQARIKPGRYLQRFYGHILTKDQIRDYATLVTSQKKDSEFKIAMDPDDIEHVYRNGPDSCMSYGLSSFDSSIHPVRVYGAGDLGVAYLERQGRVTARALCWPEKKVYSRVYGDSVRLKREFDERGYSQQSSKLQGARLLKIEQRKHNRNNFVVPYVDYQNCLKEDGDFLVICGDEDSGPYSCGQTNGLVPVCRGICCPECGMWSEDVFVAPHDIGQEWCVTCIENRTWRCYDCKQACGGTKAFNLGNSRARPICSPCSLNYFKCEDCDTWHRKTGGETILLRDPYLKEISERSVCKDCIRNEYNPALCEYFYISASFCTSDCGCNICNIRILEMEGQGWFENMPFFPRSLAPVEFRSFLEENPVSENRPMIRV